MQRCVLVVAVSMLGLGWSQIATAADMPAASGAAPAAAPSPAHNWNGFYAGLQIGGAWNDNNTAVTFLPTPALFFALPFSFTPSGDGWIGGAQLGANWQAGVWVLGLEGDISYANLGSSGTIAPILSPGGIPLPGTLHASSSEMNWFGTLRLRGGIAFNQMLLYLTGGLAIADIDHSTLTAGPAIVYAASAGETATGWTMGGGFEWALAPNWSLKAEYLYYDLGKTTLIANPAPANPPFQVATTFEDKGHIARVGVNFRFGPMPAGMRY